MITIYKRLLKEHCDALLKTQIVDNNPDFKGGFLCPSCKNIHGRSIDAIYAFAVAYKVFKEKHYLEAINNLFLYSDNLLCIDGGLYNDLQTEWRFTTTFHQISLAETLLSTESILPSELVEKIKSRMRLHAEWLYKNLDEHSKSNINYCTTNALALLLSGKLLDNQTYIKQSYKLINYALKHISQNNLFYGEVQPHDFISPKGCLGIDIGYNLEESLPSLAKFALISGDEEIFDKVYALGLAHLPFILPDGAIDNSFGDRNYKWTYYGSRTCSGIIPLCFVLAKKDSRFIEASSRNLQLIEECSHSGLIYGGPDYFKHNEKPCLHHSFEHINSIAFAVDNYSDKFIKQDKTTLPSEEEFVSYYKEMNSYRISNKNYILDVTDNDINIPYSGHLTGGTITLLFSKKINKPIIVGSTGDYRLTEPTNMQVPLDRDNHKPGYPRIDECLNGEYYSSGYFRDANLNFNNKNIFNFVTGLSSREGKKGSIEIRVTYELNDNGLRIFLKSNENFVYKLPLINGKINLISGNINKINNTFYLIPGFIHKEYEISSDNKEIIVEVM